MLGPVCLEGIWGCRRGRFVTVASVCGVLVVCGGRKEGREEEGRGGEESMYFLVAWASFYAVAAAVAVPWAPFAHSVVSRTWLLCVCVLAKDYVVVGFFQSPEREGIGALLMARYGGCLYKAFGLRHHMAFS